mgnify:CR=1 FL=1
MSMSTRISDLPGPSINDPTPQQIQQVPQIQEQQIQEQQMSIPNEVLNELSNININQMNNTSPNNIHMNIKENQIFSNLFVLEIANNHWGSLDRGIKIINT